MIPAPWTARHCCSGSQHEGWGPHLDLLGVVYRTRNARLIVITGALENKGYANFSIFYAHASIVNMEI